MVLVDVNKSIYSDEAEDVTLAIQDSLRLRGPFFINFRNISLARLTSGGDIVVIDIATVPYTKVTVDRHSLEVLRKKRLVVTDTYIIRDICEGYHMVYLDHKSFLIPSEVFYELR